MSDEARFIEPFEILGLLDSVVTIRALGLEEMTLEREDGSTVVIWPCFSCGGDGSHLNIGILDADADSAST